MKRSSLTPLKIIPAIWSLLVCAACATTAPDRAPGPGQGPVSEDARPASLAERLPQDTLLYGRIDPGRAADELLANLRFIDAETAEQMRIQAARAYDAVLRMASNRGFQPRLARAWADTRWHLVILTEESPAGPSPADTAGRRQRGLLGADRVVALVCETSPDLAADFLTQVKAELERQAARSPERNEFKWTQAAVDGGELIRIAGPGVYLGAKAGYLVLADGLPLRLWAALDTPALANLAETERYQRVSVGDPTAMVVGDARAVIRAWAEQAKRDRLEIRAALEAAEKPLDKSVQQIRLDALDTVETVKRLIGLDRFVAIGMRSQFEESEQAVHLRLVGDVIYEPPLSAVMQQVFHGGRAFRLPAAGLGGGLSVMWRFGAAEIYGLVSESLDDKQRQSLAMGDALVRAQTGYTIADLLRLFSGDFYFFSDLVERAAPPPQQVAQTTASLAASAPAASRFESSNLFALGVVDRQATEQALLKLFDVAQADPTLARLIDRVDYQDQVLFLIGPKREGADGGVQEEHAVAVVLLDKHLLVGGFDSVTAMIRKLSDPGRSEPDLLESLLGAKTGSTFFLMATQGVLRRFQSFLEQAGEEPAVDDLISELEKMDLSLAGDAAEADLRDALIRLLRLGDVLSKRMAAFSGPALIVYGEPLDEAYRLSLETELVHR